MGIAKKLERKTFLPILTDRDDLGRGIEKQQGEIGRNRELKTKATIKANVFGHVSPVSVEGGLGDQVGSHQKFDISQKDIGMESPTRHQGGSHQLNATPQGVQKGLLGGGRPFRAQQATQARPLRHDVVVQPDD